MKRNATWTLLSNWERIHNRDAKEYGRIVEKTILDELNGTGTVQNAHGRDTNPTPGRIIKTSPSLRMTVTHGNYT